MESAYPIATVAELMGDRGRSSILLTLIDGSSRPAGELAILAGLSAQSASGHLSKLVDGGLLTVQGIGRHRYYKLASADIAHALEALGAIAIAPARRPAPQNPEKLALYTARTCYDHLAGRIAVGLAGFLVDAGMVTVSGEKEYEVGKNGAAFLAALGIDVMELSGTRRAFARQCIDWTERKPHLAGALGAALCSRLISLNWFARRPGTRVLRVTQRGARELQERFGIAEKS
jgi:DNA-binding transcriptional ArsR family regulator